MEHHVGLPHQWIRLTLTTQRILRQAGSQCTYNITHVLNRGGKGVRSPMDGLSGGL